MANKSKAATPNHDQVSTSTSKSRSSLRQNQVNNSLNQVLIEQNNDRLGEKRTLQDLNNRLATLFNTNKGLGKELKNLNDKLRAEKELYEAKIEETKYYYEEQLTELRDKLDLECTNSAKKLIDYEKSKNQTRDLEKEKGILISDYNQLEKRFNLVNNDIDKLKDKLNKVIEENEQYRKLIQNLETEKISLDKNVKRYQQLSETERLRSISLEGKLKALEDRLSAQKHFYEKEIEEIRLRSDDEREDQFEEAVSTEVEYLKTELMMKAKRELEENTIAIKQELEKQHFEEINRLKEQLNKVINAEKIARSKLTSNQSYIDKLNAKINEFNLIESTLNGRIAELEGLLEVERNEKLDLLDEKDREIKELEEELKAKDTEHQLVADSNVQLKEEIQIYRNLLEEQEKSLENNELHESFNLNDKIATRSSVTPRRYAQGIRKRKRVDNNISETTILNKSIGPIAIDDSNDQFVKLKNITNEPVALGGWEINRINDEDGYIFKFHKSVVLQPQSTVTIYGVDAPDATHNPPVEIKMKKNWPTGGKTLLSNAQKEQIAQWEYSLSSKRSRSNGTSDDANRSCTLM